MFRMRIFARRWTGRLLASSIHARGLTGTPRWAVIRRHRCQNGSLQMTRLQQHCQGAQIKALMQIHLRAMILRRHGERVAKRGSKCVSNNAERTLRRLEGAHARTGARGTGPKRSDNHLRWIAIRADGNREPRGPRCWRPCTRTDRNVLKLLDQSKI
jgi:hypothetical protein